jgi:hypothetical protein
MKREGASPVVAALVVSDVVSEVSSDDADSVGVASGTALSVTAGVSAVSDSEVDCCEATIATKIATPRSTATRTLFDDP